MEEWKTYKLSEIGQVIGGATPSTKVASNYDGDISWITPKDLSLLSGRYIYKGERSITNEGYNSCSCQMLPAGSILFSSRAPIGYIAIAGNELCTNQGFKSIVPNKEIVNSHFLYYLLSYEKNRIAEMGSGTTFMEISGNVMKNIEVKLPPISVQNKIAEILTSLDEKIENNQRINDNLEQQAQAAFNHIISNTISDNTVKLSEIAWLNPKRTITKGTVARSIEMAHLPTTGSFPSGWEMKEYNGGMKFQNGDTLMARITPCLENGKVAFVNFLEDDEIAFGSTEYITMTPKRQFAPEVLYFLVRNAEFIDFAVKNMNGSSGRQRVSADTIGTYELPDITQEELHALETIAKAALTKIKYNSLENMRLADMRDTLLPKLMSGELKINKIDC